MSATPYQIHGAKGHAVTAYSPNGVDTIEECSDCGARFLFNPCVGYPLTLVSIPLRAVPTKKGQNR